MRDEVKKQIIATISTRFFVTLLNIVLSTFLVYYGKITGGDYATILIAITALYITGRSITTVINFKNNGTSRQNDKTPE